MIVRRGFTLVELLITVSIIGIMASMVLFAMFSAQEAAREQKTRALITKLNNIVMQRYESYRTRRVPFVFPAVVPSANATDRQRGSQALAKGRIDCLRDIMRMELPDRWSDVVDDPIAPYQHTLPPAVLPAFVGQVARPSVNQAYLAKRNAVNALNSAHPTNEHQGAECLYMIVMESLAQEGDARDVFKAGDSGDIDGDGCPEFRDAWGSPIEFIRWAPGYQSPLQTPNKIRGQLRSVDAHTSTVTVVMNDGKRLSQTPGSYVGGALALIDQTTGIMDPRTMGVITGYQYTPSASGPPAPPTVVFTCTTPSYTDQKPFGASPPAGGDFVVMLPDPFDSRRVYPIYTPGSSNPPDPDTSIPTYALYPLIISKGGDKAMGVKDGAGGGATLHYTAEGLNPFFVALPVNGPFGYMLGSIPVSTSPDGEPLWKKGCHLDNITNHDLNQR